MSPPAGNGGRVSGIQGEKLKRAEGSEQQDRDFYLINNDYRIRPGDLPGGAYPLISYEIP
jgi:hypothetical protein